MHDGVTYFKKGDSNKGPFYLPRRQPDSPWLPKIPVPSPFTRAESGVPQDVDGHDADRHQSHLVMTLRCSNEAIESAGSLNTGSFSDRS
jgi:hypothetical protein